MTETIFTAITQWQSKAFPTATAQSKICHLKQEINELHTDVVLDTPGKELEFADCFILLFGAAASDGMSYIDIINAINKKMEINYKRQWGKPNADGVINHIDPTEETKTFLVKALGEPTTIGQLKDVIKDYPDDVPFGFRNQPMQALLECRYGTETFVSFQEKNTD